MLGQVLNKRYRIDADLGKGGMGIVYRGFDTLLSREVAIKLISNPALGAEGRARLMVEARAAARLNHPNIVTVYDAVDEEEMPFLVMELVKGQTLRGLPQPSVADCIEYARQICMALAHAHEMGIIHRDLKPENVMLAASNTVKLMDFGLARSNDVPRVTASGYIAGTISYVAPELIEGGDPSPRSDLYALGIMMFELLTGNQPFKGADIFQMIFQHINAPIPAPKDFRSDVPNTLNTLVMNLMSKIPDERPASAADVGIALATMQTSQYQLTETLPIDHAMIQPLSDLVGSRAETRISGEPRWSKKGYSRSSLPVLEPTERPLILKNRSKELTLGIEHLKDHRLLLVNGMPGIGKSTFARALLEFIPDETPPPFWYDFERQQSSGNTLGILLDRISGYLENCFGGDVRQEVMAFRNSPEGQASAYEVDVLIDHLNTDPPIWLVFDNMETVLMRGSNGFRDEGLELLFDGLKSNTHNARIILTNPFVPILHTGQFLLEFGSQPLTLRGLGVEDSVAYLRGFGLEKFPDDTLRSLAQSADGHPFTLNHLAHYTRTLGVDSTDTDLHGGMEETTERFKVSLQKRLSKMEFEALQAISILNREITLEGLCQTAQVSPIIIKRLREEGLLQANDTGRFWMPNIVKTSLRSASPEVTQLAHMRANNFYRSQENSPSNQDINDFDNVLEWHHHAVQAGDALESYKALFSTKLRDQLMDWNEYGLLADLCEATLSVSNSGYSEISTSDWVTLQHALGIVYFLLEKYEKSITNLKSALRDLSDEAQPELRTRLFIDLAESYNANGDPSAALEIYRGPLNASSKLPDVRLRAKALQVRGIIQRGQGNLFEAINDLEDSLKAFEEIHDRIGIAYVTGELGIVYYYQNQFHKALENYQRALDLCEARRDMRGAVIGHFNVGDILLQDMQYDAAIEELQQARDLAHKRKLFHVEVVAGLYLAEAQIALSLLDEAEAGLNERRISLVADSNFNCASGHELGLRATLLWKRGYHREAEEKFASAFSLLDAANCQYERARIFMAFAAFLKNEGRLDDARTALKEGREIFIFLNNQLCLKAVDRAIADL